MEVDEEEYGHDSSSCLQMRHCIASKSSKLKRTRHTRRPRYDAALRFVNVATSSSVTQDLLDKTMATKLTKETLK
ncbi:hypothetical protein CEXT_252251 [Caerostris extrusa]|uniref:Uncharacterized protein n=1 Tax=Caerostris extrusa TaxID=172846 RepID=A0AAV4W184_CAEEX|nr:hypothetical protein CEXT_252251 [Caerostris extrusa]